MVNYKLFCLVFISILLVGTISAFEIDNVKDTFKVTKDVPITIGDKQIDYNPLWEKYKPITIENAFGLPLIGSTLFTGAIDEHTETCGENCHSTMDIYLANDGSLIDDVNFLTLQEDKSWIEQPIRNYQFYVATSEKEIEVDDYKNICTGTGEYYNNGLEIENCVYSKVGTHIEKEYTWQEYNLGEDVLAGNHKVKLVGEKKSSRTVDWVIKTNGEWLDEWANWGGVLIYSNNYVGVDETLSVGDITYSGVEIIANRDITITNITLFPSSVRSWCNISDESNNNLFSVAPVGTLATFNYNITANGSKYRLTCGGGTMGYNGLAWSDIEYDDINITNQIYDGAVNNAGYRTIWYIGASFVANSSSIDMNSPIDYLNTSNNDINFNCSANITSPSFANWTLWTNLSGAYAENGTTTTNGGFITQTDTPDGTYLWGCQACDSDGACGYADTNRTFTVDIIGPAVNIISPSGSVDSFASGNNLSLNWTTSDTHLDVCWFNYNSVNTTVNCADSNYSFTPVADKQSTTLYANDTFGNIGSDSSSWIYKILENSQTYNTLTYGSSYEDFILNITYDSSTWSSISASLMYNDTAYVGTKTGTGDTIIFSKSIQIPTQSTAINKTFYWSISMTNASGTTYYNSTFNNQTVSPIVLHLCDAVYTIPTLNFTIKEAGTFSSLNGSIEATFDYWGGGDGTISQEYSFANTTDENTNYAFCIAPAYANFTTNAVISYYKAGYDRREYYLNDYSITNTTQNISLYLTSSATTDIFTITVIDENQDPVSNANINVLQWDIGTNTFYKIGDIVTTQDGTGIINLRLYDTWYKYQVLYDETLYLTTEPAKESSTSRTLTISFAQENPYNNFDNIQYSLTYNNQTNVSVFEFSDTTGTLQIGCLNVLEMNGYGNTLIYDSCVESSSGTLSYYVNSTGTYVIRAIFRLNSDYGSVEKIVDEIIINGVANRFVVIGKFGQVISLVFTGTMAMIGIASGSIPLGLFLIIVSLFVELKIGWINISSSVLYGFISVAILIALGLKKK